MFYTFWQKSHATLKFSGINPILIVTKFGSVQKAQTMNISTQ